MFQRRHTRALFVVVPLLVIWGQSLRVSGQPASVIQATLFTDLVTWQTSPAVGVHAELYDAGGLKAVKDDFSDEGGRVSVRFVSVRAGGNALIHPPDRILLRPAVGAPLTVTVPALTVDVTPGRDRIVGTAPPGEAVELTTGVGGSSVQRGAVIARADGSFDLEVADWPPNGAGQAKLVTSEGHRFSAWFAIFRASVTLDSPAIDGFASPGTTVAVELKAPGQASQHASGEPNWPGGRPDLPNWRVVPPGQSGVHAGTVVTFTKTGGPLASAQQLGARMPELTVEIDEIALLAADGGPDPEVRMQVPELTLEVDRPALVVRGRATPGGRLSIGSAAVFEPFDVSGAQTVFTPDGRYSATFTEATSVGPGQIVRAHYRTPGGHIVQRNRPMPIANIAHGGSDVCGFAAPHSPVDLTLRDPSGQVIAATAIDAMPEGSFDARLRTAASALARIRPGDLVVLTASGETANIQVEPLGFDYSSDGGLIGVAPPERSVHVRLRLRDGRQLAFERMTDSQGRLTYGPADLPPRADWTLADVYDIRLALPTPGGHQIVVEERVGGMEVPVSRAYLPFLLTRR